VTVLLCYGIGADMLGSFSRQGCGTRQSLRPGDELDSDQERSFCLNARSFQTILMFEACCKGGTPTREEKSLLAICGLSRKRSSSPEPGHKPGSSRTAFYEPVTGRRCFPGTYSGFGGLISPLPAHCRDARINRPAPPHSREDGQRP
jgi:hypothetical protein